MKNFIKQKKKTFLIIFGPEILIVYSHDKSFNLLKRNNSCMF